MKPRPSHYNGAILKKLVIFLRKVELFRLQLGRSKEEDGGIREKSCEVRGTGYG